MTTTLYVMRHGHAVMRAASDAERPLSDHGEIEVKKAAEALAGISPAVFIASPYLRAQQTAKLVKSVASITTEITTEENITPDDHPLGVVKLLSELAEPLAGSGEILMVSHNPLVSALVSLLVDGHYQGGYAMDTASIACIDFDQILEAGQGTLRWLNYTN